MRRWAGWVLLGLGLLPAMSSLAAFTTLSGTITDATHNTPCAGAWICVDGGSNSVYANSQGLYLLANMNLAGSGHYFQVTRTGFANYSLYNAPIVPGQSNQLDTALYVGSLISGVVTDASGNTHPGLDNQLVRGDDKYQHTSSTTVLSHDGGLYALRLPPGDMNLRVESTDYASSPDTSLTTLDGVDVPNFNFQLYQGGTVSGLVTAGGVPVAYASVSATVDNYYQPRSVTFTAADGTYTLFHVYPAAVNITVRMAGYADGVRNHVTVTDQAPTTGVDIALVEGATLQGTVQDYEGMPVASARVTAFPSSGNSARQIQGNTDASGFYTLPGLQVGSYSLNVQWEGSSNPKWLQREQISGIKCTAGSVLTRNFTLQRGSQIRGTVFDSQGAPLPGASVRLMLDLEYPFSDLYNTTTDSLGAYQINGLAPSQLYALSVSGPSSRPMEGMAVKRSLVIPESQSSVHDLQLVPGGAREGTVRNAQGSAVTPGMTIVLNSKIGMGQEYSSSQGRYRLAGVPEGDYLLILYPMQGNYSEALSYCHVTPGVTDLADVEIPASNVLEGKVYDAAHQPVPNCKVLAQNRFNPLTTIPQFNKQAFTDSSGYYRIEGLSDGSWFAEAQPDAVDTTGTGNQAVMHLAAAPLSSGTTRVQDITLPAGGVKVFGTVRDQYGNRIPGSLVYFWRPGATAQQGSVQTDDWGNYALMLPPGTYSAHALYTSLLGTNLAVPPETNLTVASDRILQHDFIMQPGGTLQGECTDQLGRPEALAMVSVYESDSPAPARIALTDNQGHYAVEGLHTGAYQLQVTKPGFATLLQTVNTVLGNDVSGFRSVVVAQTDISGNVRGRGGQGVEGALVQALDASGAAVLQTFTQGGGDYVLTPLSGGPYQVKAAGTGLKSMTLSGIYPGGRADFVLEPLIGKDDVISYPNPCRGQSLNFLFWADAPATAQLRVYNQAGELVWDWEGGAEGPKFNRQAWEVSGVAPGVYLFKLKLRYADGAEVRSGTGKLTIIKK